ncbi:MAG: signal recognition particle protein [Geminicoccaceae bacterium]
MFDSLSQRLSDVFDRLKRRGALSESDVDGAMRDVRIALLEADVALPVVKDFVSSVRERAVGQEVVKSVTPGQMVVKIVHDGLVELLGSETAALTEPTNPPMVVMMVGLQGSGKTTSSAKLGLHFKTKSHKSVLLASLDTRRPAAQEQLAVLAAQAEVNDLPVVAGQAPVDIAKRAMATGRTEGFDVVVLDTAGRLHVDDELMAELEAVRSVATPQEILLVADSLTGQDAVNVAKSFDERLDLSGIILTRMDGDARGGAALSMRQVTGKPIKLVGTGEKLEALEPFHPERVASRILGMGDVVSLVEKAAETIDKDEAEKLARKMQKGSFDLNDYGKQLAQMKKMGGMKGIMAMLPGVQKAQKQIKDANLDEQIFVRQAAIISSMTKLEKRNVKLIGASRKRRIAAGSGTSVQDVNKLLKQFQQMQKMMKRVKKMGNKMPPMPGGQLPPGLLPH